MGMLFGKPDIKPVQPPPPVSKEAVKDDLTKRRFGIAEQILTSGTGLKPFGQKDLLGK